MTQEQLDTYARSPEAAKVRLLIRLAQNGDHEFAAALLREYPLQGEFASNRTLYIEGLILKSQGDLTGSVKKFRAALADDPKLTMVRAELAKTLVLLDEDDSAKHHLRLLAADAPDEQSAGAVRSFIDQVDAKRPYQFSGYVGFAPSSNVNNGGSAKAIYLPQFGNVALKNDNAAKSGFGAAAGLNGSYTRRIGNDWLAVVSGGVTANADNYNYYNSFGFSEATELRRIIDGGFMSFGGVMSYSNAGNGKPASLIESRTHTIAFGPRLSIVKSFGPQNTANASIVYELRNTRDSTDFDGYAVTTNVGLTHAFDSTFTTSFGAGLQRLNINFDQNSYFAYDASVSAYKELSHGVTLNASTTFRYTQFDDMSSVSLDYRHDKRLSTSLSVTKRDFNFMGFAPSLSYSYTRNWSDVVLYDFDTHAVDFRLTKDF